METMFEVLALIHQDFYYYRADTRFVGKTPPLSAIYLEFGEIPNTSLWTEEEMKDMCRLLEKECGYDIQYGIMEVYSVVK